MASATGAAPADDQAPCSLRTATIRARPQGRPQRPPLWIGQEVQALPRKTELDIAGDGRAARTDAPDIEVREFLSAGATATPPVSVIARTR